MNKKEEPLICMASDCGEPATWVRYTQFSGDHPYCTRHALEERGFAEKCDGSTFDWSGLSVSGGSTDERESVTPPPSVLHLLGIDAAK